MSMPQVKHISFDFWNTLAIANPCYARCRSITLGAWAVRTEEFVNTAYKKVKARIDDDTLQGDEYTVDDCFHTLVPELNRGGHYYYEVEELKVKLWKDFHWNPPTILPEILTELYRLKALGYTMSIGSNTNFIPGQVIKESVLLKLGIFDYYVFSDEIGVSKPSRDFFYNIRYNGCDPHMDIARDEIIHIGDSSEFDYHPAIRFGFQAQEIDSPHDLPRVLKTFN